MDENDLDATVKGRGDWTMRSAERSIRVFVSSATETLRDIRHAVGAAIEDLGMQPFIFEETPPSGEEIVDSYMRHIPNCEYFVWLAEETTTRPTENEVRLAIQSELPTILVIELEGGRRDDLTTELIDEVRQKVRTATVPSTRESCAEAVELAIRDDLNRAKRREVTLRSNRQLLPAATGAFTDRVNELERILRVGGTPGSAVVLSGMGGVGKSALAIFASHQLKAEYPDTQLYLDLSQPSEKAASGETTLATKVLRLLGVSDSDPSGLSAPELLRQALSSRGALVLIDNAGLSDDVGSVLDASGNGIVIVTSRDPLVGLEATTRIRLEPLENEFSIDFLVAQIGQERTELDTTSLERIADLCGHLPLALRIAGARIASRPTWNLAEFAEQLSNERNRLEMLEETDVGVRSSFNLSFFELDPRDADLFAQATFFEGSFSPEAAAALVEIPEAEAQLRLERMVDLGLLRATGIFRYEMHALVRIFGKEKLEALTESSSDSRRRLARWYLVESRRRMPAVAPGGEAL